MERTYPPALRHGTLHASAALSATTGVPRSSGAANRTDGHLGADATAPAATASSAAEHHPAHTLTSSPERKGSTERSDASSRPAAHFQAKLQRAVWLDRLTTFALSEAQERAAVRCAEAEARESVWWAHQRARGVLEAQTDYEQRRAALKREMTRQRCSAQEAQLANLVEEQEPLGRQMLEMASTDAFRVLCLGADTILLQRRARQLAQEHEAAVALHRTAHEVRALELKLAAGSYRAVPCFNPRLDDLSCIAEGHCSPAPPQETPAQLWRRRFPPRSLPKPSAHRTASSSSCPSPSAGPAMDLCDVRIAELYARRGLRYDEEKERLLLDRWASAGHVRFVEEAHARAQLRQLYTFVASPVRMSAVVVLQRWWRLMRTSTWRHHSHERLVVELKSTTPGGRLSSAQCRRHLQLLERLALPAAASAGNAGGSGAVTRIAATLAAVEAAATHRRRHAVMLDLYTYTLLREGQALFSAAAAPGAAPTLPSPLSAYFLPRGPLPLRVYFRYTLPFDAWRQHRWALYSEAHRRSTSAIGVLEEDARQTVTTEETRARSCIGCLAHVVAHGALAVHALRAAQLPLQERERQTRQRVGHQEALERSVWEAQKRTTPVSVSASSSPARVPDNTQLQKEQQEQIQERSDSPSAPPEARIKTVKVHPFVSIVRAAAPVPLPLSTSWTMSNEEDGADRAGSILASMLSPHTSQESASSSVADTAASTTFAASAVDDAAKHYHGAFDSAAACVYTAEYSTVLQRYSACNASLLRDIRRFFRAVLERRATLALEEAEERQGLVTGHPSAQHIRCFELMEAEERERRELERTQINESGLLAQSVDAEAGLLQWAETACAIDARNDAAATTALPQRSSTVLRMPQLSPADRLASREDVCRARILHEYVQSCGAIFQQGCAAFAEMLIGEWPFRCYAASVVADIVYGAHPPAAQLLRLAAEESTARAQLISEWSAELWARVADAHALYGDEVMWRDFLFDHLKMVSEASYMDDQLLELLRRRLADVPSKLHELVEMEAMARGRVAYAEFITRDLRFRYQRLRLD